MLGTRHSSPWTRSAVPLRPLCSNKRTAPTADGLRQDARIRLHRDQPAVYPSLDLFADVDDGDWWDYDRASIPLLRLANIHSLGFVLPLVWSYGICCLTDASRRLSEPTAQ